MSTTVDSSHWDGEILWRRVGALVIDFVPVLLLIEVVRASVGYTSMFGAGTDAPAVVSGAIAVGSIALYFGTVMAVTHGRTLGKYIVGVRVTTADSQPPRLGRVVWREAIVKVLLLAAFIQVGGVLEIAGFLLIILDFLWARRDSDGRLLHDVLAGTNVVRCGRS
jgi:uncharacterized RDD family membrane protein YckC